MIIGTKHADVIIAGAGNDTIEANHGDDTIIYISGDDVIAGEGKNFGFDTLDLSSYAAADVRFSVSGRDVFVTTPDGEIQLQYQVNREIGDHRANIEQIVFLDGTLDEAGIRDRAIADQGTVGDDSVTGTKYDDVIVAGAGNDTIRSFGGDDVFVFHTGDGVDTIIDFQDGADLIEFNGTGLGFGDLAITESANNTIIDYGSGDTITLTGIDASLITVDDFAFA